MSLRPYIAPYGKVVLASDGWVTQLKTSLSYITADTNQAFHEMMYAIIEAVRHRDRVFENVMEMVQAIDRNLYADTIVKQQFSHTVKHLALHLYYQLQDHGLYGKPSDGLLMYTYVRHPCEQFDDVMLSQIISLTYNRESCTYEPPYLSH